mgnify:FL=1
MSTAASVTIGGEQFVQMTSIMKVDDGKAAMQAMKNGFKLLQGPEAKKSWEKLGIEMQSSSTPAVRKLHGWPVDRYEYSYKIVKPDLQQAQEMFNKLSNMKMEVAQVGNYLLFAMGDSVDAAVNALMTGKGAFPTEATKRFPAGGSAYIDVDLKRILETLEKQTGRPLGVPLPQGAEIVSAAAFDGGSSSQYQLYVPKPLVDMALGVLISNVQSRSRPSDDFGYDPGPMGPPSGAPPP